MISSFKADMRDVRRLQARRVVRAQVIDELPWEKYAEQYNKGFTPQC